MKRALASFAFAAALVAPTAARAQDASDFSARGANVIVFDHLFGFASHPAPTISANGASSSDSGGYTEFGLLTTFPIAPPYLPRLGYHRFFGSLSLGAGFHYSNQDQLGSHLALAPRIGFASPFGSGRAIWIRGGITYARQHQEELGTALNLTQLDVAGELFLVFTPLPSLGVTLGPFLEYPLSGTLTETHTPIAFGGVSSGGVSTSQSIDAKYTVFGVSLGFLADF